MFFNQKPVFYKHQHRDKKHERCLPRWGGGTFHCLCGNKKCLLQETTPFHPFNLYCLRPYMMMCCNLHGSSDNTLRFVCSPTDGP